MKGWWILPWLGLVVAACSEGEDMPEPPEGSFTVELDAGDSALLAVTALGADLVTVGGPLVGDGAPAIHRRAGEAWGAVTPPAGWLGAIWWIWAGADDEVWVVGDRGQVAHGPLDALQMMDTGALTSTHTVFYGAWGSGADDVWIVGGAPRAPTGPAGTILRWDGQALARVEVTGTASVADATNLFKVWGSGPEDVMVVGTGGLAIHYNGSQWVKTRTNVGVQITTVHGLGPYEMYAVGGVNQGLVLRYDGFSWTDIGDRFAPPLSGVYAAADGKVWVAGESGYFAWYDGSTWTTVDTGLFKSFHAVHVRGEEAFGVGGILTLSTDPREGFVGRFGPKL